MERKWILKKQASPQVIHDLVQGINVNPTIASILAQRGITTFDQAKPFFRPSLQELHDPFLMKDMDKAVNRLCEAVFNGEKILIYGDYDVDGTTAVATVFSFLKKFTDQIEYYIPDRYTEGYGVSETGVRWASENQFNLLICLDCGIRATDKVKLAKELNVDVIICDHHIPGPEIPDAIAVLDPKQPDCPYPFKELCGCGVGFKLLQGFCLQNTIDFDQLFDLLDFVAVSIASDIVPMVGENRILAHYGLKKLNQDPSLGLRALKEISGMNKEMTISDVVFYLGPRINAAGRLTHARESVNLLIGEIDDELKELASTLNDRNTQRKDFDQSITAEALEMIEEDYPETKSTMLFKKDWHKGVVGIVASRCIEHFYRPTIILTESEGKATGSARSVDGFDVHEAIGQCGHLLDQFGGHMYAAGLSLSLDKVEEFREEFEKVVEASILPEQLIPKINIDQLVGFDFINFKTMEVVKQMAPFGPQNLEPTLWSKNVFFKKSPRLLKDKHLKATLYQEGIHQGFDAIGFGMAEWAKKIDVNQPFQILYNVEENEYRGNKSLQLNLKDIKLAE